MDNLYRNRLAHAFRKACERSFGEALIDYDLETKDLPSARQLFPRLENLVFDTVHDRAENMTGYPRHRDRSARSRR